MCMNGIFTVNKIIKYLPRTEVEMPSEVVKSDHFGKYCFVFNLFSHIIFTFLPVLKDFVRRNYRGLASHLVGQVSPPKLDSSFLIAIVGTDLLPDRVNYNSIFFMIKRALHCSQFIPIGISNAF